MFFPKVRFLTFGLFILLGVIQLTIPNSNDIIIKNEGQSICEEKLCLLNKTCDFIHTMAYTKDKFRWLVDGTLVALCDHEGCPVLGEHDTEYSTNAYCTFGGATCDFLMKILDIKTNHNVSLIAADNTRHYCANVQVCSNSSCNQPPVEVGSCNSVAYIIAVVILCFVVAFSIIGSIIYNIRFNKRVNDKSSSKKREHEEEISLLSATMQSKNATIQLLNEQLHEKDRQHEIVTFRLRATIQSLEKQLIDMKSELEPVPSTVDDLIEAIRSDDLQQVLAANPRPGPITDETDQDTFEDTV